MFSPRIGFGGASPTPCLLLGRGSNNNGSPHFQTNWEINLHLFQRPISSFQEKVIEKKRFNTLTKLSWGTGGEGLLPTHSGALCLSPAGPLLSCPSLAPHPSYAPCPHYFTLLGHLTTLPAPPLPILYWPASAWLQPREQRDPQGLLCSVPLALRVEEEAAPHP